MRSHRFLCLTVGMALAVPLLAGCSGGRLFMWPWQKGQIPTASPKNPVHRIVCMWEPSEGRGPDGLPARGFAGQVLFFTRTSSTPVKVEGDVSVYVFDDQGPPAEQARPIHQFNFQHTPEGDAWNRHLTIGTLGPSYNVFIPYTRRGRHQARCMVQVRFAPPDGGGMPLENGKAIFSDMTMVVLPGPVDSGNGSPNSPSQLLPRPVQTVSHYIDTPFGRQPVDPTQPSQTQTHVSSNTPAIGSVVQTPGGMQVRQDPQRRYDGGVEQAGYTSAGGVPLAATAPASDADRLTRIEQMLEQLAAQQCPAAAPPAGVAAGVAADSRSAPRDWNQAIPPQVTTWSEPAPLGGPAVDRRARRLAPRPSWFEEDRQPEPAPPTRRAHPLGGGDAANGNGW
ncbi:MAG TPA: hypothetical protein VML55_03980 [Planctomycetaceae bacterium]|nr:hypothetical protein [Planctomycetaceae bacterium]